MNNKQVCIGIVIGLVYTLIPFLGVISWGDKGGDPGPYWVFMIPLFWPAYATLLIILIPVSLFFKSTGFYFSEIDLLLSFINVILWVTIGAILGLMIKKRKEKRKGIENDQKNK